MEDLDNIKTPEEEEVQQETPQEEQIPKFRGLYRNVNISVKSMDRIIAACIAVILIVSMLPASVFAAETRTVYLDPAAGLDTNNGLTEAKPVKTVAAAYQALSGASEGRIVFLSTLKLTALTNFPSCSIPVTLTSKTGAEGITASNYVYFRGPTTLENMTFTSNAANSYTLMSAGGHKFTIGEGVTSVAENDYHFCPTGGSNTGTVAKVDMTVKSGPWRNIYVVSHSTGTVTGDCNVNVSGCRVVNSILRFSSSLTQSL